MSIRRLLLGVLQQYRYITTPLNIKSGACQRYLGGNFIISVSNICSSLFCFCYQDLFGCLYLINSIISDHNMYLSFHVLFGCLFHYKPYCFLFSVVKAVTKNLFSVQEFIILLKLFCRFVIFSIFQHIYHKNHSNFF